MGQKIMPKESEPVSDEGLVLEEVENNSLIDFTLFHTEDTMYSYNDPTYGFTSVNGIDVSAHQKNINWYQVKESGIDFAMIRLGYRGYQTGLLNLDEYFQNNLQQAKDAGVKVGIYFYSQALTEEEAKEEAKFVLNQLNGISLEFPIAYDLEISSETERTLSLGIRQMGVNAAAFCEVIRKAGYTPMIYGNSYMEMVYSINEDLASYPLWFAHYTADEPYSLNFSMWQYNEKTTIDGVESNPTDINVAILNKEGKLVTKEEITPKE